MDEATEAILRRVGETGEQFWDPEYVLPLGKIRSKSGALVPFRPWDHQLILAATVRRAYQESRWPLHVKSRRVGSSTFFTCIGAQHACFRPGCKVAIMAHKQPVAMSLAQIAMRWHGSLPDGLRARRSAGQKRRLVLPGLDSSVDFYSVKDDEPMRGETVQVLIATEISSWAAAGAPEAWTAALNAVSDEGGFVIGESTPRSFGDELHLIAQEADTGSSRWLKVFIPWTMVRNFAIRPPASTWRASHDVREYADKHHLSESQAYWMQVEGLAKCRNNLTTFRAEYPISEVDCWLSPGDTIFDVDRLLALLRDIDGGTGVLSELHEYEEQEPPKEGKRYIIAVDPAGSYSQRDKWAVIVLCVDDCAQVAEYLGHAEAYKMGRRISELHERYNRARMYIEANGIGEAVISQLMAAGLGRSIYHRAAATSGWGTRRAPGWYSNAKTKAEGTTYLQELITDGSLHLRSARLIRQLLNVRADQDRQARDEGGGHYDLVNAAIIAAWAWRREAGSHRPRGAEQSREGAAKSAWDRILGLVDGSSQRTSRWGTHL